MGSVVINPGTTDYFYFPQELAQDFAYRFARGSKLWCCLLRYPRSVIDPSTSEAPAIFRSDDAGSSWNLLDDSGAPISNKHGLTTVTFDSRFNSLDPATQTAITFMFADDPVSPTFSFHLCDFDLDAGTYGSPYSTFTIDRPTGNGICFSTRPDGSMVALYGRQNSSSVVLGTFYRVYSSGSWGAEQTLESGLSHPTNMAVDSSGNVHILTRITNTITFITSVNYYRLDSTGAVVAGPTAISTSASRSGNLVIDGTSSIYFVYTDGSNLHLAIGVPVSSPTWLLETVGSASGIPGSPGEIWVGVMTPPFSFSLEVFAGSSVDEVIDSQPYLSSGLTVLYTDGTDVKQYNKSSGSWVGPTSIWTPPFSPGGMNNICARTTVIAKPKRQQQRINPFHAGQFRRFRHTGQAS